MLGGSILNSVDLQIFKNALKKFEKEIRDTEKSVVSCCGLTFTQCNTIVEIGKTGFISLNKLADLLEVDNSTMSQTVSKMVKQKLVVRETDPSDRRYVTIALTEEGKKAYKNIDDGMNEYYASIYASIPKDKRGQIIDSLSTLKGILKREKGCKHLKDEL